MNIMNINDIEQLVRDIKLNLALNNVEFPKPNINRLKRGKNLFFNKKWWGFLKNIEDEVITGSASLFAFGLIDREPGDLDLLIDSKNLKYEKLISNLYTNRYIGMENEVEMLGYLNYKNKFNVDYFDIGNSSIIEHNGFRYHNPLEIVLIKQQFRDSKDKNQIRMKDYYDIKDCVERLNRL